MSAPAVIVVDCPEELHQPLHAALLAHGLLPTEISTLPPELILVWLDPYQPGAAEQIQTLRACNARSVASVVVIGAHPEATALTAAQSAGADAYTTAADAATLAAVAALAWSSRRRFAAVSPLTGLPGNGSLEREITRRLPRRGELAILAFDVDDFKAYNDRYGYLQGDALLHHVHAVVVRALAECAQDGWYVAHVGGDDFVALMRPAEMRAVAERAIDLFKAQLATLYAPEDVARGGLTVRTRTGEVRTVPLASLTVAGVTNQADDLRHAGQLAAVLAELKAYGKGLPGSNYVPDRRQIHDIETALALKPTTGRANHIAAPEETDG